MRAAFERELDQLRQTPNGARNDALNRAAFAMGQFVGAGVVDHELIEIELVNAAQCIGLGGRESAGTVRSGLEAGIKQPRRTKAASLRVAPAQGPVLPRVYLPGGSTTIRISDSARQLVY